MKTFIEYLNEERKGVDLKDTLYALFNISPKSFDKALERSPSPLANAIHGDDEIGLGIFDIKKAGKNIYQIKSRDDYGDIRYYNKVKMSKPIKSLVNTSFVDYIKSQGLSGSEKTLAPKEGEKPK